MLVSMDQSCSSRLFMSTPARGLPVQKRGVRPRYSIPQWALSALRSCGSLWIRYSPPT